jgi:GTPase SAR1 family protein
MINSVDTSNPHQTQFSVYVVGEENVGKSALVKRYTEDSFLKDEKPKL